MARTLVVRTPSDEERRNLERLAHARTAAARLVERAHVVLAVVQGERAEAIAARFQITAATVYLCVHRFNDCGVAGLDDRPRTGRRPTYSREQVTTIIAKALTSPRHLDQPFASWTPDRLVACLQEHHQIAM